MNQFEKNILNHFGKQGEQWLSSLAKLIKDCEKQFHIKIEEPFEHQSFNFSAPAKKSDGEALVIKLSVPTEEVKAEIAALSLMQGPGMVNLLASDKDQGILLLERLTPGKMLSTETNDKNVTEIFAILLLEIQQPVMDKSDTFPRTQDWFERLSKPVSIPAGFPAKLIDKARHIAHDLHQERDQTVLLHGDLHHFNILSSGNRRWIAIDPKGVIGTKEYEVGAFLRNPIPEIAKTATNNLFKTRIDCIADITGFDHQKIVHWGLAQAVLAAIWCIDANSDDWQQFISCAEYLEKC